MKNIIFPSRFLTMCLLLNLTFLFSSCSMRQLKNTPSPINAYDDLTSAHAVSLLNRISSENRTLDTFKGIGQIRIKEKTDVFSLRLAFIGSVSQENLRFSVMDVLGRPIETVSFDGKRLYLLSHTGDHKFLNIKGNRHSLEKIISVALSPEDIIWLLSGRVPLEKYDSAYLDQTVSDATCISLFRKKRLAEKIFMDMNEKPASIQIFEKNGSLSYKVVFTGYQMFSSYNIPSGLEITDQSGNFLSLKIEKYWPNPAYSPEIFKLSEKND